jgi:octaprenyl-diphosphate synthase
MLELRDFKVFEVLSHCSKRMAQGELVQASRIKKLDITEEIYLHMIADKTAALISAACQLGGITAGADEEQLQALARFGELWGMAFQIEDDILDYEGDPRLFGKPVGSDLQEKKITLPLIYTLERMTPARRALTRLRVRLGTRRQIRLVLESVREADGLGYARKVASGLVEQAVANLEVFPPSPLREALSAYARDTLTRKY